ncbi:glycosyltransferase family 2 protein [Sulfurimonas sp.]
MKISICIATYNGEKYLKQQLDSILDQLENEDEVIISDDGSTDNTLEIIKSCQDSRVQVYDTEVFQSPIFNFENALKYTSGDIIVLCDQDDIWEKNKLATIKQSFEDCLPTTVALRMYNGRCIDENGVVIEDDLFEYLHIREGFFQNIVKNSFIGCNIAFTRALLEKVLPFPKKIPMHDVWLGTNAYLYGEVKFIDKKVFRYRIHKNNYSLKNNSLMQKVKWRVNLVSSLIQRYIDVKYRT